MTKVSIVYHAGDGFMAGQAEAVARGALSIPAVIVHLLKVEDVDRDWVNLMKADAILFGTPTFKGGASASFKSFMEASFKSCGAQGWKDKLAGGFTHVVGRSGGKCVTLEQLASFAAQHGMIWVTLGRPPHTAGGKPSRPASHLGAMARSYSDGFSVVPTRGDLQTAECLGRRVAQAARRWTAAPDTAFARSS